jgi:hypothetical protein
MFVCRGPAIPGVIFQDVSAEIGRLLPEDPEV